jgi:uncharacterized protein
MQNRRRTDYPPLVAEDGNVSALSANRTVDVGMPGSRTSFITFVTWVIVLASPFWTLGWAAGPDARLLDALPLAALQFIAPLAAAVIAAAATAGPSGLRKLFRRTIRWRSQRRLALAAAVAIMPTGYAISWLAEFGWGHPPPLALETLPLVAGVFIVSGWAEEVGWTGYALGPGVRTWGPVRAALIIGLLWAALHVIPDIQAGHDLVWITAQRLGTVAQRVVIVWIVLVLGGTVMTAAIAHAMDNISWALFTDSGASYDPLRTVPATLLLAALVLIRLRRHELGERPGSTGEG